MSPEEQAIAFAKIRDRCRIDPMFFFREVLGCTLDEQQERVVRDFPSARRMAVKSGHSCFGIGTRLLMYDGTTKAVEDLAVGDRLMGDDSTPRTVQCLFRGRERMCAVMYRDGTRYVHNESHILCLVATASHFGYKTGDVIEISIADYMLWNTQKRSLLRGFRILPSGHSTYHGIESIQPLEEGDYYGFNVDGNHRFLGADFMVLRNSGKDFLAARLALWFHISYYPSIVVTTGPTDRQIRLIVWGEIHNAHRQSKIPIGGELLGKELRSKTENHYMVGYTSTDPSAFTGIHAPNVLVIVTEAQGIKSIMWPSIESLLTASQNAKLLLIGNAIYEPDSEFYAAFTSRASSYVRHTLRSDKSDYCSKEWVKEIADRYGADSPYYRARVLGEFPTDAADTLIPDAWIERAHALWDETQSDAGPYSLGVDVARQGSDHTIVVMGSGRRFEVLSDKQGYDTMETVGLVRRTMLEHNVLPHGVNIDEIGVGSGVVDRLREMDLFVRGVNVSSLPASRDVFKNLRSEAYWNLRNMFREGRIAIDPRDSKLTTELSVLTYKDKSDGLLIVGKADLKKKLGYSPDRADALMLAALGHNVAEKGEGMPILDRFERDAHSGTLEVQQAFWPRAICIHREPGGRTAAVWMLLDPYNTVWVFDHIEFQSGPVPETVGKVKARISNVRHVIGAEKKKLQVPMAQEHVWIANVSTERPKYSGYGAGYAAAEIDEWLRLGTEVTPADAREEMAVDDLVKRCRGVGTDGKSSFRVSTECPNIIARLTEFRRSRDGEPITDALMKAILYGIRYFTDAAEYLKEEAGFGKRLGASMLPNYAHEPGEEDS